MKAALVKAWLWFRATLLIVVLAGCGASALDHSTTALGVARAAQAGAVRIQEAGLGADLDRHCAGLVDPALEACARERGEEFRRSETALEATRETVDTLGLGLLIWAERVVAGEADEDAPPLPVCEALAQLAAAAETWAAVAGTTLPVKPWTCPGGAS